MTMPETFWTVHGLEKQDCFVCPNRTGQGRSQLFTYLSAFGRQAYKTPVWPLAGLSRVVSHGWAIAEARLGDKVKSVVLCD